MEKINNKNLSDETDRIYKELCVKYGEFFNFKREEKGLSLRELSKQTNISIALISLLENGDKLPRIETLIKLMSALDIPYNEIFGKKASDIEFNPSPKKQKSRTDEELRNILLKYGCDKDDIKDIIQFIQFKIFKKNIKTIPQDLRKGLECDFTLDNKNDGEEYKLIDKSPLKKW